MKKTISLLLIFAMCVGIYFPNMPANEKIIEAASETGAKYNYAEVLQKSLYFYECQQAGPLPDWNRVEWRADSTMTDYVLGGWYDAGDNVKFNLPMSYSASMLAWGLYQYPNGVKAVGQYDIYKNNLEFVLDYFVNCDEGDGTFVYQVGNGTVDHTWWGPVELVEYGYKGGDYYNRAENGDYLIGNDSAVGSSMAAALAAGYCALPDSTKRDQYLETAKIFFEIADTTRSDAGYNSSDAQGFYQIGTSTQFWDNLLYAANWLYMATGDQYYLDKCPEYIANLPLMAGTGDVTYGWGMCWDDTSQGALLLYAINTGEQKWIDHVKKHIVKYWIENEGVTEINPGGLKYLTTWGCLRHATAVAFTAKVAIDTVLKGDSDEERIQDFIMDQINYCLGDNQNNRSYVVGFGEDPPTSPHHRTAHGSWKNDLAVPEGGNRHIIYGALVGGPNQDGTYEDDRGNFINNEIATDYNAGFTALLCGLVEEYGGTCLTNFPEPEVRTPEYYCTVSKSTADSDGISLLLNYTNHTAWPARVDDNMSFRYYLDLSEVGGTAPADLNIRVDWDESEMGLGEGEVGSVVSFKQWKGDIWYVEVAYPDGTNGPLPISEGKNSLEFQFNILFAGYDASNDWSYTPPTDEPSDKICIYNGNMLVFGTEPDGSTPEPGTPEPGTPEPGTPEPGTPEPGTPEPGTPEPSTPATSDISGGTTLCGDVNLDGAVRIADLVDLCKHVVGVAGANLTGEALINADCDGNSVVDANDALTLAQYLVKKIGSLPHIK
ncbi:MAG: glycoside hydrolase family 9 protein [Ruminococcus sp.]|jgi:hypothetical protein|nr:glycoside hydrolase family 9 protein [Ruminococcus sp.]